MRPLSFCPMLGKFSFQPPPWEHRKRPSRLARGGNFPDEIGPSDFKSTDFSKKLSF